MIDLTKRVSTADFNNLVETNRPNIIAYAMMLSAGDRDRDAMVLLSMTAIWKVRKNYHPGAGVEFNEWCFKQITNAYRLVNNKLGAGSDLMELVKSEATVSLPEKGIRMAAFDRAFFGLSNSDKSLLSISCQHPRLQENYIRAQKGLDRKGFDTQLNHLRSTLLVKSAWKGSFPSHGGVASSDQLSIQHLAAGSLSSANVAICQERLLNDPVLREYYYSCVSLQQALITRLQDDPSTALRDGGLKHKRKGLVLTALGAVLILVLYSSANNNSYINRGVHKAYYSVVPEPSSVSLLGVGLGVLLMRRSREPVSR